ncbi:MAG TPA: acetoin utilization protein AcuC [bacterium]|nr:acetoin utilization protein AcuC [bacterium]
MCSVGLARIMGFEKSGFPAGHPMRPERVYLALKVLEASGVMRGLRVVEFDRDDGDDCVGLLRLFHEESYIRFVKKMSDIGEGLLDYGDTPAFPQCYEAYSHVVKASAEMCRVLLHTEHAVNLYGGLHHAQPNRASGFCVFNDVAVAIRILRGMGLTRIAYIDIDAHHGDGVMYPFYSDPNLLILDFHEDGRYLFPGTGSVEELGEGEGLGKKVNIVLPPYASDADYLYAFSKIVPSLIRSFKPEVILLQAGVDAHSGDPLTHLELSDSGYLQLVSSIHSLSHDVCGGRLIAFGGGGYGLSSVARCWAALVAELTAIAPAGSLASVTRRVFEDSGYTYDEVGVSSSQGEVLSHTRKSIEALIAGLSRCGWELNA